MTSTDLESLRAAVSSAAEVSDAKAWKILYARDSWPYLLLQTRAGNHAIYPPDAVVVADSIDDCIATVNWCRDNDTPLVPYGAGSGVAGAAVPVQGGVILDCKRLRHLDLSMVDSGMVRVGAGWLGMRLEHELNRRGLTLGHFPSSIGCSTVGGWLATRSAGQFSTRYGKIEDLTIGLRYIDANGQLVDTFGESHDTTQLLLGSEGTLGVIVDGWLRVEPMPKGKVYRGFMADDIPAGIDAMRYLMQAGYRPSCLRLYDEFDTLITGTGDPKGAAADTPGGLVRQVEDFFAARIDKRSIRRTALKAARALLSRTVGAPIVMNRAADGLKGGCLLVVGFEEETQALADTVSAEAFAALGERLTDVGAEPGEHWHAHRYDVSYKQSILYDGGLFVDTMEVATTWDRLPLLYKQVRESVGRHVFIMAHFSHAYAGGGSIYFTFAGFGKNDADCIRIYKDVWRAGMDAVARAGAAVTHHHGVGILKADRLYADHAGGRPLYTQVKEQADPTGFLNPGKLWQTEVEW